jgi:hypothetical protein
MRVPWNISRDSPLRRFAFRINALRLITQHVFHGSAGRARDAVLAA